MTDLANRTCPFPDCDWSDEYDPEDEVSILDSEGKAESHYENEHAGRVEIQVTLNCQFAIGDRSVEDIRTRISERFDDRVGWEVAHVRSEVLEEPDDHSKLEDREE